MRVGILILLFIFLISGVSASCNEGQIDINSASAEKLTGIIHIGPSRAEQMITLRPFDSVDDMIRINGIGEYYLANITTQGLACVNGQEEDEEVPEEPEEEVDEELPEIEEPLIEKLPSRETTPVELQTINLNPKVIKSEDDNENLSKSNYAIYGLVFFCVLLVVLFILRKNKYNKNDFR
jgi:hypothetical protein